ncbi:hypothetical protein D3C81_615460 [compost metagenome]
MQVGSRCHHAIGIVQHTFADDRSCCRRRDAAFAVVQHTRLHIQRPRARMLDLAILVRNLDGIDIQVRAVDGDAAGRVVKIARLDAGITRARLQDGALGVV